MLHFEFTTKPFTAIGLKSSCANLIDELKKYLPNYAKNDKGIHRNLAKQTSQAIVWSKQSLAQAKTNDTDNPTTYIHELVEYLQNLMNIK